MTRYILLFTSSFCITLLASANNSATPPDSTTSIVDKTAALILIEDGKNLYTEGKVKDALIKFRQAALKDPLAWKAPYWISRCHFDLNNFGYALKYAQNAKLLDDKGRNKEQHDLFAECYHKLGQLDSAIISFERSLEKNNRLRNMQLRTELRLAQAKYAKKMMAQAAVVQVGLSKRKRLSGDVNSGYDDYSPVLFNEGKSLYFTSRRSNTTGGGMNPSDQRFFEDIYLAKWDADFNEWDSITNKVARLNGEGFESMSHISDDGMLALITLNTEEAPDERVLTKSSDICEIEWTKQGRWSRAKPIKNKTINTSFFDGAPTITADGNTMYFTSDRKGEKTASDIYVVEKVGKRWGDAKPLPMTINTKGRESTPYITPDGNYLFFSSDGYKNGMGGYDIYVVENQNGSWGKVKNLGPAFNSVTDDLFFKFYPKYKKAYLSSFEIVRDKSSMDIYEVNDIDLKTILQK